VGDTAVCNERCTACTPDGPVQRNTMAEMKAFCEADRIEWHSLYPSLLAEYQAVSGRP